MGVLCQQCPAESQGCVSGLGEVEPTGLELPKQHPCWALVTPTSGDKVLPTETHVLAKMMVKGGMSDPMDGCEPEVSGRVY